MSTSQNLRIQSQLDTPHAWILGKMFRIKSWEIGKDEIENTVSKIIKGEYKINQIHNKEGELKGITLLYVQDPEDLERIRTSLLITDSGTELRKTSQLPLSLIKSRTIKTTAPLWVTKKKVLSVFSKYNTDKTKRCMKINKVEVQNATFPIVRFYPTIVNREGVMTKVNVIYIEFSPLEECKYDSLIALSMEHRCKFINNISGEEAILIFDRWTVEKDPVRKLIKETEEEIPKITELTETVDGHVKLSMHEIS